MRQEDRARGALYGLAIGDALGMPTQMLSRQQVVERWGPLLTGFEAAPDDHPIAAGMPAGAVTDDTEQAVLLGRLLVRGEATSNPAIWRPPCWAWERDMAARGSLDLLGPSTKRALAAVEERRSFRPRRAGTATPTAPRCASPRSASRRPPTTGRPWSIGFSRPAW